MAFDGQYLSIDESDLREAQRGAIYAAAAHRSSSDEAAQLILPTGVGKTLVAALLPYVLRATKVLVVTPARIVRDQVAFEFSTLRQALDRGGLSSSTPKPSVLRADHRCTQETWDRCDDRDVVVGTPAVLSHGNAGVDPVPAGLFDLVIFDEAHHLPATTWTVLYEHLKDAYCVLLTATPFRTDRQRLPGDIAYEYPLRRAVARGVYKPVRFVPVESVKPSERDGALASKGVSVLREARHQEVGSKLLVRTDRKTHAEALVEIYRHAGATVVPVLDRTSGRTVRTYLERMAGTKDPPLDGLIVVGAMTEGFDFPRLKVAVYHQPHRTLAPTLQFIGRLARAAPVTGDLIAFAEDVSEETALLYRDDAVWEELLPAMVDSAVDEERTVRRFTRGLRTYDPGSQQVPALAIAPPRMTHVYRQREPIDLDWDPDVLAGGHVIESYVHPEDSLLALVTRHRLHPRFLRRDMLDGYEYFLHVVTWIEQPGVLCVSTELDSALKAIRHNVAGDQSVPVDAVDLTKLLLAADLERCFSVGTRPNTFGGATNESYRMSAGPNAQQTISPADARAYVLGHVMGRRRGQGSGSGTFGFSSGKAKLWEPKPTGSLAEFRGWCLGHASVLAADPRTAAPGSRLALLQLPDRLESFPESAVVAVLPAELLLDPRRLLLDGVELDPIELIPTAERLGPRLVEITITAGPRSATFQFFNDGSCAGGRGDMQLIERVSGGQTSLADFFDQHPPTLLFGDGSVVVGQQIVGQGSEIAALPPEARLAVDWSQADLEREFPSDTNEALDPVGSVAGATLAILEREADWIVQDHLPGELADFIAVRARGALSRVELVHCKKPAGTSDAPRVTDIQEVLAQAMRSIYLATSGGRFWTELDRRLTGRSATKVVKGDAAEVAAIVREWISAPPILDWAITAVQPGVRDSALQSWTEGNALLSAAYSACSGQGVAFRLIDAR